MRPITSHQLLPHYLEKFQCSTVQLYKFIAVMQWTNDATLFIYSRPLDVSSCSQYYRMRSFVCPEHTRMWRQAISLPRMLRVRNVYPLDTLRRTPPRPPMSIPFKVEPLPRCLIFGLRLTLCTLNIYLLIYLLIYLTVVCDFTRVLMHFRS